MDQMELRSGKALVKEDYKEDSDNDPKEDVQNLLEGYVAGGMEDEEVIPPRRIEVVEPQTQLSPLHPTMDISSVRCPLTSAMTSVDQTSTRGLPQPVLELQRSGRFNIRTQGVGFDVCREEERKRRRDCRRLNMEDLTNQGIEATLEEMEKEMCDLKRKMKELTKTEETAEGAWVQRLKMSDREPRETSGSDRKGRMENPGELRAGGRMLKVGKLTGKSLIPLTL